MPLYRTVWRGIRRAIYVVQTTSDCDRLLRALSRAGNHERALPVDIEYSKDSNEPAVVSIALTHDTAILWHRPEPDRSRQSPETLAALLTSPSRVKIGFSIDDDLRKLAASTDLLGHGWPRSVLDVQALYRLFCVDRDPERAVSMEAVVNHLIPASAPRFFKMQHDGDWTHPTLTDDQILYAAGDVFIMWEVIQALSQRLALRNPSKSNRASNHSNIRRRQAPRARNTRSSDDELVQELLEPVADFLLQREGDLPRRPDRLRNLILHSCQAVAALQVGERRKAAAVDRTISLLSRQGIIVLG